ncbi:Predicted flavoprotein [Phaffia rhodozyma]|uniref:Predicted flavoprotein n=1 Tax=Phaffia rhodozyma TaxID=264483 RepID=A0A0F7SRU4_PHARH|nr:Predicted flavoprotein [Phaffia rhodozyma]
MSSKPQNIGLLLGSPRTSSNTSGICTYLLARLTITHPDLSIHVLSLTAPPYPLPFEMNISVPQALDPTSIPSSYSDPRIQAFSSWVAAMDRIIILTPQYNWSVPGILKVAIDHLYHEWVRKPIAIMTLGGRGGGKCQDALRNVFEGTKSQLVKERVEFVLPPNVIRTEERIKGDEDWLKEYDEKIAKCVEELLSVAG